MAKDGLFFRWCAQIHPKHHTPHWALAAQCVWAAALVAMGTYSQLTTYVIFAGWVFYALTSYAVIVLRRKLPDAPRPYRVVGYPWVPMLFVLASTWFLINILFEKPRESGLGVLIVLLGVPVYLFWKRRDGRSTTTNAER
jgi:basic amino acid/polyamine antiporter, APA family